MDAFFREENIPCCAHVEAMTLRGATVALVAVSWLAVSNHCALGLAAIETHSSDAVSAQAHDCCASEVPSAAKTGQGSGHSSLQDAAGVIGESGEIVRSEVLRFSSAVRSLAARRPSPRRGSAPVAYRFLNTGPPGGKSFR